MTALLAILACVLFPFTLIGIAVMVAELQVRLLHRRWRKAADAHLAALRKSREARA